jgi:hypothetical protein
MVKTQYDAAQKPNGHPSMHLYGRERHVQILQAIFVGEVEHGVGAKSAHWSQ